MASVIKLTAAMFPEVHGELLRSLNPHMPPERWQLAFSDRGWHDEDHFGYVLMDDGRPVGVLGALFSRRVVGGREEKFCNLHGWYVKPEYRAGSLLLLRPVLALTDHTITDFSASREVIIIMKRLGFSTLDDSVWVLPQLPWPVHHRIKAVRITGEVDPGLPSPMADMWRLLQDHRATDCCHFVFTDGRETCGVIFSRSSGVRPAHCEIHHIANPAFFSRHHAAVRSHLMKATGTRFVVVESRLLPEGAPLAFRVKILEKLYRSPTVPPELIDTLYSEIVLLNLATPYQGVYGAVVDQLREWKNSWS